MKTNFTSWVISELISSGYLVHKCQEQSVWCVCDGDEELVNNRSLGDCMAKAAKLFDLEWN